MRTVALGTITAGATWVAAAALPLGASGQTVAEQLDPAHTGVSAEPFGPPLQQRWKREFAASLPSEHSVTHPLAAGGRVFVVVRADDGTFALHGLDPRTGATVWQRPLERPIGETGYGQGKVLVAAGDGLHAFDGTTGAPAWSRTDWPGHPEAPQPKTVIVAGGDAFVAVEGGSTGDSVYAIRTADAGIVWQQSVHSGAGLAVTDDRVYVNDTIRARALDRANGSVIWETAVPEGGSIGTDHPTVAGGRVYVSGGGGAIFDAATGSLITYPLRLGFPAAADDQRAYGVWEALPGYVLEAYPVSGARGWQFGAFQGVGSYPLVAGDVVYMLGTRGLYALDKTTGAPIWCDRPDLINDFPMTLALGEGLLLVAEHGELRALEPGGRAGCPFYEVAIPGYTDPFGEDSSASRSRTLHAAASSGFLREGGIGRRFVARTSDRMLVVQPTGLLLAIGPAAGPFGPTARVAMTLRGARGARTVRGERALPGVVNDYSGANPNSWRRGMRRFRRVRLVDLKPGVDMLVRSATNAGFEYDLVVRPGADPGSLVLDAAGSAAPTIDPNGALRLATPAGELVTAPPVAYQRLHGRRVLVAARFELKRGGGFGFEIGNYDEHRRLMIDPVLQWSTYLGGGFDDEALAVASDPAGNIYVVGSTRSRDMSAVGALDQWNEVNAVCDDLDRPCSDAFVAKYTRDGKLVHLSYLSGSADERALGVAADPAGNAYVTGQTVSPDFPVASPLQPDYQCGAPYGDAFVTKLSADGRALAYSTYLGACGASILGEVGRAVAVDGAGRAIVAGSTNSNNFPTTPGAADTTCTGEFCADGFVARIGPAGDTLEWSTFFGDDDSIEDIYDVELDSQGRPVIVGETWGNLEPGSVATPGTYDDNAQYEDGVFAARLAADGSAIEWATPGFGGSRGGRGAAVELDSQGDVHIAGGTGSRDFPTTEGALDRVCSTKRNDEYQCDAYPDAFALELSADGSRLLASTFIGGAGLDIGEGLALDARDRAYVVGLAGSELGFPLRGAYRGEVKTDGDLCALFAPCGDAFVVRLNAAKSAAQYGTLHGGKSADVAYGVALASGDAWVAGTTHSPNLGTTAGAPQPRWPGGNCGFLHDHYEAPPCSDGFVSRVDQRRPAVRVRRRIRVRRTERGIGGRVVSRRAACRRRVPVVIERRRGGRWRKLAAVRTTRRGRFASARSLPRARVRVRLPVVRRRHGGTRLRCEAATRRVPRRAG